MGRLPLFVDLEQVELDRVINAVNSFVPVSLAPADECYWEEILQIRNNNSECFTSAEPIGKQDHWCFMAKHSHTYRVALRKVLPGNKRSLGFFRKLGFVPRSEPDGMKDAPITLAKMKREGFLL